MSLHFRACIVVAAFALHVCSSVVSNAATPDRPNILLILSDDQGMNDVGCYGSEIPTPNLDSLAAEGLRMTQCYAASSICTPSRFGLLTGQFAHRSSDRLTGALMFLEPGDASRGIRAGEKTYVEMLRRNGYATHLVGKWHLGHGENQFWPTEHGFDTFFGHTGGCVDFFTCRYGNKPDWYRGHELVETTEYATDVIASEAVQVIKNSSESQPWYLHLAFNAPHFGKGYDKAKDAPVNLMQPKPSDLEKVDFIDDPLRRSFAAKVVGMDQSIGMVLAALKEAKQESNTLVIFMTDHGGAPEYGGSNTPFRGGKATLYEGGIRVPCIVRWPGVAQPGQVSNEIVTMLDWFPTFLEILNDESDEKLDGQSVIAQLGSKDDASKHVHRPVVWVTGAHDALGRKSWKAVRSGKWKLVESPSRDPELFDVVHDPNEQLNLVDEEPAEV
ncbi:MAG: sulfatase-like hydrolase/transferase, partial [Planctomycetota bacterium]